MRPVIPALAILFFSVHAARATATRIHFEGEFSALENGVSWNLPGDEGITGSFVICDEHLFEYNNDAVRFRSYLVTDFEVSGDSGWWFRANQGLASTAHWVRALNDYPAGPVTIRTVEVGAIEAGTRHLFPPIFIPSSSGIDIEADGLIVQNEGNGIFGPPPPGQVQNPPPVEIIDASNLEVIQTPAPMVPEPLFKINLGRAVPGESDMPDITAIFYLPDTNGVQRSVYFRITEIAAVPEPGVISMLGGACSIVITATTGRRRHG